MEVTRQGETKTVEVDQSSFAGLGGIGLLGTTPDGEVETQTNSGRQRSQPGSTTSDGGAATGQLSSPLDEPASGSQAARTDASQPPGVDRIGPGSPRRPAPEDQTESSVDRYCGSCAQFKYVRTDTGIRPYCAYHDELMDDMEACADWQSR
jgi:hypothetical protein